MFGHVSLNSVTKHGGKTQGKVLSRERLNLELSITCSSLASRWPGCTERLGTTQGTWCPFCNRWLPSGRETGGRSAGFGGRDTLGNHDRQHGTQICESGILLPLLLEDLLDSVNVYAKALEGIFRQ